MVFVSSGGMYSSPLVVDDLEYRHGYNGVRAYARTKKMQVVLADSWARRLAGSDVRVESMHPGWVDTPGVAEYLPRFRVITKPLLRDVADGADTAVWLVATRPSPSPDTSGTTDRNGPPRSAGNAGEPGQSAPLPRTGQPPHRDRRGVDRFARLTAVARRPALAGRW